jgi:uncharacterized protein YijF (DUF1287 family)
MNQEYKDVVAQIEREDVQRAAFRVAEKARIEARRANRDPLETTLNYVFRAEQRPERQQWFERLLERAQDMAQRDPDMRDLLVTAGAIRGNSTVDRVEEARVVGQILDRAFHSFPKNQQDWLSFKPNTNIFHTMASDLVGRFHAAETPVSLIEGIKPQNAGDVFVDRLLRTKDPKVKDLVRKLAPVGTNRGETTEVFEPTQELVDLFAHAYRLITHRVEAVPMSNMEMGIVRRIATDFVRREDNPIGKLYGKHPNPDWPKHLADRLK